MELIKAINNPATYKESAELDYFFDIIDQFLNRAKNSNAPDSQIPLTLITRSPESCIAKAVYQYDEKLKALNIELRVIFSQLNTSEDLSNWLLSETSPCGSNPQKNMRWAKRPNLADAHEQLTLGSLCSWSGESMRRDVNARFGVYMFDEHCEKSARLAQRSFSALWKVCQDVPQTHFKSAKLINNTEFSDLQNDTASLSKQSAQLLAPEFTRH